MSEVDSDLSLLCDPLTHEALQVTQAKELRGSVSGREVRFQDGIPVMLQAADVQGLNAKYQKLYDRFALLYDVAIASFARLRSGGLEKRRREYLKELEIRDGSRVLEVSVGTGQNLRFLPPTATYYGVDISIGMLRRCRKNLKRWRRSAFLVQGAAERLPFVDAAFDSVLHMGGINFFSDKATALREMVRVAKPGTKVVIVDETEKITRSFDRSPVAGVFYKDQHSAAAAPVDFLPSGVCEVSVKTIADGELYCMTFRRSKP